MPVISRFYGIAIVMYFNDHNPPHCHAKYSGYEAIFDFDGNLIEGELPARAANFVTEWILKHITELNENWNNARSGQPLKYIEPLE